MGVVNLSEFVDRGHTARKVSVVRPRGARPLGNIRAPLTYLRSIALDIAHRVLIRRRRSRAVVRADYEAGGWSQELTNRTWERCSTLRAYLDRVWVGRRLTAQIDGQLWSVPAPDFYRFRRARLVEIMQRYSLPNEPLVELGSGTGSIVFELALEGQWRKLLGLELSPTGRQVADIVTRYFEVSGVEFAEIDLLDENSPGYRRLGGQTVYTHYCLEQLPDHTEQILRSLIQAGIKRAILIEPSYELLRWYSLRDLASMTYVLRQDYQRSIVAGARTLEREGLIRIVDLERLDFVSGHRNAATLLVFDVI